MGIAVGIDLGTTNSCVAVVQGKRARVVEDASGKRIQPSVVSYCPDGSTLTSWDARERLVIDPENTYFSFKRLLGRDLSNPEMGKLVANLPYKVISGPDGIPAVETRGRAITLPELSAMMLQHLKSMCQQAYGMEIDEAVITVPANFDDVQRSSTKIAGRIGGFKVLRILNEPTAAALAYGFGGKLSERIAVYDFGGGTFDITIIELMDDIFEVLSTAGDTYLGGDDFDDKIAEEMVEIFLRQHRYDLRENPSSMQRVRTVAERIKCQLSSLDEVEATLRELAYGPGGKPIDFTYKLTRQRFEKMIEPMIERSLKVCDEALKLADVNRSTLDNLVLVGGTTRVPLLRRRVADYFGREPRVEINPDEVVAIGAALHACSLTDEALPEDLPQRHGPERSDRMLSPIIAPAAGGGPDLPAPKVEADLPAPKVEADLPAPRDQADLPAPRGQADLPGPKNGAVLGRVATKQRTIHGLPSPSRPQDEARSSSEEKQAGEEEPLALDPDLLEEIPSEEVEPLAPEPKKKEEPLALDPDLLEETEEPQMAGPAAEAADDPFGDLGFDDPIAKKPEKPPAPEPPSPPPAQGAPISQLDEVGGEERSPDEQDSEAFSVPMVSGAAPTLLLDVTPRALGVATAGGYCDTIIERNASIPMEQSRLFTTSTDNQTEVAIDIYQGESRRVEANSKLGTVHLSGIRPAPRGEIKVEVAFEINTDGILGVSARNKETGKAQTTRIQLTGGMSEERVEKLVEKYSSSQG
ncbi:MAG: Hsp70 family protein [Polyangia bacterium]